MSGIKKQTAIQTLAAISHAPESAISDTVEKIGLAVAEKLLLRFGYTFDISAKTWVKKERS